MAFQEQAHHNKQDLHVPVQRARKRKLSILEENEHVSFTVGTVAEPPLKNISRQLNYDNTSVQHLQFIWLYLHIYMHQSNVTLEVFWGLVSSLVIVLKLLIFEQASLFW